MFYFSFKYNPRSLIKECVDSVLKFHPNDKIVIIDSESEDKSYYEQYSDYKNVIILDGINKTRQVGSFEIVYDHFPNEEDIEVFSGVCFDSSDGEC